MDCYDILPREYLFIFGIFGWKAYAKLRCLLEMIELHIGTIFTKGPRRLNL